ncbi:MAG: PHP domain-containing protein [Mailhella sp.]|jgi:predicted metal-dependent phosphoesterase TrpH|nr:PHP domain-containing protein [Mailhella sp.]
MKPFLIDLHTHSTASDGTFTPAGLIRQAQREGLSACALTDHDTVAGLDEAQAAAKEAGMAFVRGCELSARCALGSVHVLGLWLPRGKARLAGLERVLAQERASRLERNRAMVGRFNDLGIDMAYGEVEALAGDAVIGRPHFAALLLRKGVVSHIKEAFQKYLKKGGAAYVERRQMGPEQAVDVLRDCGALVALAHPGLIRCAPEELDALIASLKEHGLDAVEAFHSAQDCRTAGRILELARRCGLAVTGGSDFHGACKPDIRLGHVLCGSDGGSRIGRDVYDALRQIRKKS